MKQAVSICFSSNLLPTPSMEHQEEHGCSSLPEIWKKHTQLIIKGQKMLAFALGFAS